MATALKVKEAVKESLLGTEEPAQLSAQTRSTFLLHAKKDPKSGESYMGRDEFINAIAPPTEDYVCSILDRSIRYVNNLSKIAPARYL